MLNILKYPDLKRKVFFTLLVILIFRLLSHIPVPGVDIVAIRAYLQGNAFFGLFDLFSGGGFQNFSIVTLGLAPYINASIIMQLFMFMIPSLEELAKEGEYGREKINMYTRLLTVPITLFQSYGIYFLLIKQKVITPLSAFDLVVLIVTLLAGTMLLVWIGELVSEYGVGNGISLLIFVSIIGRLPASLYAMAASLTAENLMNTLLVGVLALAVIMGVVYVNEGTRNITIEYGRTGTRLNKVTNFLPVKVNQAGVIPIIFAVSLVMLPSMLGAPLQASGNGLLQHLGDFFVLHFSQQSVFYNGVYFLLVLGFTYFYTTVQFNPDKISDDIKKRGGFIPGIRPGKTTSSYLRGIVNKITLAGGLFLAVIAIMPFIVQTVVGVSMLTIGGTSLLIVVSVVLETLRQIESLTNTRSYERYLD